MKNVTQTPPSNTASTFTVRSSSSAAQSSGPPVMVLLPGGGFAIKTPTDSPALPTGNPALSAGKSVSQPPTKEQGVKPILGAFTQEKGGMPQSAEPCIFYLHFILKMRLLTKLHTQVIFILLARNNHKLKCSFPLITKQTLKLAARVCTQLIWLHEITCKP